MDNGRIEIYMNDFMKNAGIAGLVYLLRANGAKLHEDYGYGPAGQFLWLDRKYATEADWTNMYFRAFVEYFADMTTYAGIIERVDNSIKQLSGEKEIQEKKLKEDLKFINEKLLSNSYQNGFANMAQDVKKPEIYELLRKNKLSEKTEKEELLPRLKELNEFLQQEPCRETFVMKSLAYNYINRFWDGRSFLLKTNAKKDMKECFEKDFSAPLVKYWKSSHEKAKELCIDCGKLMENKEKISIAFMVDAADDLARKRSAFWNCTVDAYLCPECAFIYALAPLGFQLLENKSVFLNINNDIEDLVKSNAKESKIEIDRQKKDSEKFSAWLAKIMNLLLTAQTATLQNIQVILKSSDVREHYVFQVINKEIVEIFKDNIVQIKMQKLAEHPIYKLKDVYLNIYEKVFFNIMGYKNQYGLINYLLKQSLRKDLVYTRVAAALAFDIQIRSEIVRYKILNHVKGGSKVEKRTYAMTTGMQESGYELREKMRRKEESDENFEDRIRGTVYQLLNALSVKNNTRFLDIAIRLYSSLQMPIPSAFRGILGDEEEFQRLGYAFVLGLKGSFYNKDDSEKEAGKGE